MFVYFISGAGLTKIGLSEDPERRIRELQLGCPIPLTLQGSFEGNWRTEAFLHETYADSRQHGEWFTGEFTPELVKAIHIWVLSRAEDAQATRRRGRSHDATIPKYETMRERSERLNAKAQARREEREIAEAARSPWERHTDALRAGKTP